MKLPGLFLVAVSTAIAASGCTTTSLSTPDQSVVKCQLTLSAPQAAIAALGGTGSVGVNAAPECAWSASTETTWITDIAPAKGQGPASIQFKAAPNAAPAVRQGDISVSGTVVQVSQEAAACVFDVTPRALTVPFTGGPGSLTVTTIAGCAWSAVSQVSWITVTSPRDNSGAGTVTFDVAASTDSTARTGSMSVAGQTFTVSQAARSCVYVVDPPTQTFGAAGGAGTLTVTTAATCTWTAVPDVAWITIASGASGTASGTVGFGVAANTGGARTGHITVGTTTVTVVQAAPAAPACSYSITPSSVAIADAGGTGTVTVATPSGCTWTATSNAAWIVVTAGASSSGPGSVAYSVAGNTGAARSGTLLVAGQTFTVNQAATPCTFGISPTSQTVTNASGTGTTVMVTTQAACAWTAVSNDSWIAITPPATGVGSGSFGWTYNANTGGQRTGTMTVAGQTFTVTQDAGCSYVISPTSQTVSSASGTGTTVVVTTQASCAWTAGSNDSWITITPPTSGAGSGSVAWTYSANTGTARSGTMTIAGQTFTVSQAAPCVFTVAPLSQTISALGGSGTPVTVTTTSGCTWTAVSNDAWITITSGASGNGTGTVQFTVDINVLGPRSGTLTIAGQTVTVNQQ